MTTEQPSFVILLIDPGSGEIEAYGPVDAARVGGLEAMLRAEISGDGELGEIGVLVLRLNRPRVDG